MDWIKKNTSKPSMNKNRSLYATRGGSGRVDFLLTILIVSWSVMVIGYAELTHKLDLYVHALTW